ncbi:hypothetical protein ACET3Z_016062 [Daucus carota]
MSTQLFLNSSPSPNKYKKLMSGRSFSNATRPRLNRSAFSRSHSSLNPSSVDGRQMLLAEQELLSSSHAHSPRGNRRFNEVAGGTTAEIAAIACCAPFSIADLLVLAVYKVPTGLCRKALREKRQRRLMRKGSLLVPLRGHDHTCDCGHCYDMDAEFQTGDPVIMAEAMENDGDMKQLEKEMWEQFYGTGFWRSHSRAVTVGI